MKLTKKIETEITQFLQKYWDTYFEGNLMQWQSFITEDYKNIGTNQEEIWNSKREILDYTNKVLDQMVGNAVVRNKTVQIIPYDPYIMTHELGDLYIKNGKKWTFYAPIRLSSLIQKQDTGWIVLHQHGSFPDSKTQKGEAFAVDAIKAENIKLQKAVQKRTIELEQKNRELEVETALERIRAQAVAMKESSDLLDIVVSMRNEFIKLGHEAHYFWHMMWLPETYEKAMTSGDGSKIGFVMELPRHIHGDIPQLAKWEKSKKPTVVHAMNVDDALDYVHKMVTLGDFQNIDPQAPTEDDIRHIGGLTFIMARTSHGEIGYSLPGVVKNPPKEDIDILVKFAGAFDLAHQRFLDLQKAEKQAREVEIQLALEKIRSRSLAVHKTEEFNEVMSIVFEKLKELNIPVTAVGIGIQIQGSKDLNTYVCGENETGLVISNYRLPYFNNKISKDLCTAIEKQIDTYVGHYTKKQKDTFYKYVLKNTVEFKDLPEDILNMIFESPSYTITMVASKHVVFNVNDFEGKELSTDDIEIIKRVAKVFNQAYIRFLDLQQAEIQAQKTQIELSLERIRSQVTAMQASSDLFDIVVTMRNEFLSLGHEADYFWHMNWAKDNYEMSMTAEDGGRLGMVITVPKFVHEQMEDLHQWEKSNSPYFVLALNGKDAWDYIDKMNTYGKYKLVDPHAPSEEDILHIGGLTFIIARTTHGEIGFSLAGKVDNPPQASIEILVRFASVFDLAYKRFEDLKKAEAQTRETQIELALEKVRSRSMAMQKSDELSDAAEILYKEFYKLGVTPFSCGYLINNDTEKQWNVWMTDANNESFKSFWTLPYNADQHIKDRYENWQKNKPFHSTELKGDANIEHHKIIAKYAPWKNASLKDLPESLVLSSANFKYGHLLIVTGEALSEGIQSILIRFAKVFEQTYTRFLDLRKAEAQTRETQIELALEKVRSRTMAMQHSDELQEASFLLDQQVRALGIKTWGCAFNIYGETESTEWFGNEAGVLHTYTVPREGIFKDYYDKGQKGETLVIQEFSGDDCVAHYEYMSSLPVIGDVLKTLKETNHGFPTYQIDHVVYFKYGYLLFITREHVPDSHAIFKRFAKVFEQTYTRFLDLQKAEAQAREAQIEAALERVRSQSMGMQSSNDFSIVTTEMFNQLGQFGGNLFATGIVFCDKHEGHVEQWHSIPNAGMMSPFIVPKDLDYIHQYRYDEWKKGTELFEIEIPSDFIEQHFQDIFNLPSAQKVLKNLTDQNTPMPEAPPWEIDYGASFKHGYLLVSSLQPFKETEILPRFAKVFEQAYTRFLDLQKAETQAREAQIEATLERVRSRSMAMHKSEEIGDVAFVLFEQLKSLGGELWGTGFGFCKTDSDVDEFWFANEKGIMPHLKIPNTEDSAHKKMHQGWKKNLELFSIEKGGKALKDHYKYMLTVPDVQPIFQGMLDDGIAFPTWQKWHAAYFKYGYMLVITTEPYPNETIFKRFAKVFEQAYIRFLDLQKAEAQAKEAQIEAALERVRSRSMAMHQTKELQEVIHTVHQELLRLNIGIDGGSFIIVNEDIDEELFIWGSGGTTDTAMETKIPYTKNLIYTNLLQYVKNGNGLYTEEFTHEEKTKFFSFLLKQKPWSDLSKKEKSKTLNTSGGYSRSFYVSENTTLLMVNHEGKTFAPNENAILERFAKVFEQAYTRFLDLKKAEAQAREAQIEAALERVRSRSLAMQKSDELLDVIGIVSEQANTLGLKFDSISFGKSSKEGVFNFWMTSKGQPKPILMDVPYIKNNVPQRVIKAQKQGLKFLADVVTGNSYKKWNNHILTNTPIQFFPEVIKNYLTEAPGFARSSFFLKEITLYVMNYQAEPFSDTDNAIFNRFAQVFDQSYTRFLDLQKAEAQAREAQIEAALERVRSRSIAMHKSEELLDVINVVSEQLQLLNIKFNNVSFGINDENKDLEFWMSSPRWENPFKLHIPYLDNPMPNRAMEARKNNKDFFSDTLTKKENNAWHKHVFKHSEMDLLDDETKKNVFDSPGYARSTVLMTNIFLTIGNYVPKSYSKEENEIFKRFAKVFEQSYTRFLDLQKAETQTRKAQIEASLERVRAKAMAMHDSNELDEVLSVLCEQFDVLGIVPMSTHMTVLDFENNTFTFRETGKFGNRSFGEQTVALDAMDNWKETVDKWKADKATAINKLHFPKEQLAEVWEVFHESFASMPEGSRIKPQDYPDGIYHTAGKHPFGYIGMNQVRPATEEEEQIVIKFANEFGMAYQRFLDLQKAEAQAREAQIEAALEKVRSRSLAMHNANELKDVVVVIVEKLKELGVILDANGVTLCTYFPDSKDVLHWIASPDFSHVGKYLLPYFDHVIFKDAWQSKESGEAYFSKSYSVENKNSFFEHAFEHSDYKHFPDEIKAFIFNNDRHTLSFAWQKNSAILIPSNTGVLPTDSEKEILIRFSKVFEQAYIRFMDLKKAEAQTREAHIEAGLEKVRSRSLAMDGSNEMQDVANEIFYQMQALGLQMDAVGMSGEMDATKDYDVWIGGSTFKKPLTIPYSETTKVQRDYNIINANRDELFTRTYIGAIKKEYIDYLLAANSFPKKLEKIMVESDAFTTSISYSKSSGIQIVRYSAEPYTDEENQILIRFAKVFEQAYVRFRDIEIKEEQSRALLAEKKLLEKTLSNLQATQKQLIQSEKMASLGELTAGIAHEIQNPLNFVNNFSEVSKELLDEMLEEMENGDLEEVKAIMDDVIQNLEKINHHGKRADGIVKGMLQHSRASGNKKEPTNINALADEYLRLAYHGLRAKDKSFNAQLVTDFDKDITTVNVIPQDLGRVILNLLTNAFYAVNEKNKTGLKNYEPTVSISTKKKNNNIEIKVSDNGNGMPNSVKDKIFQPFFTTKPTGQGTGLGLSMSYDIITKGHDGELQVDTKEEKGTTFKIIIPLTSTNQ